MRSSVRQDDLRDTMINRDGTRQPAPKATHPGPGAGAKRPEPAPNDRPLRILLAENNRINQRFAVAVLSKWSVEVASNGPLAASGDEAPLVDTRQLDDLAAILKHEQVADLISVFVIDTEAKLSEIAALRAEKAFEEVAKLAHSLVSSAGNLGAVRASRLARVLEEKCRNHETVGTYPLISQLARACEGATETMNNWLAAQDGKRREIA